MLCYVPSYSSFLESQYTVTAMQHQGQKKIRRKARGVCDFQACGTRAMTEISVCQQSSRLWFKDSIASSFAEVSGSILIVYFSTSPPRKLRNLVDITIVTGWPPPRTPTQPQLQLSWCRRSFTQNDRESWHVHSERQKRKSWANLITKRTITYNSIVTANKLTLPTFN